MYIHKLKMLKIWFPVKLKYLHNCIVKLTNVGWGYQLYKMSFVTCKIIYGF